MMTMGKMVTMHKLLNLQTALAECGIESEITEWENTIEGGSTTKFISLRADLWNCINEGTVLVEVYAEDTDDFEEIQHYAQSEYEDEQFRIQLEKEIAEMQNEQQ